MRLMNLVNDVLKGAGESMTKGATTGAISAFANSIASEMHYNYKNYR